MSDAALRLSRLVVEGFGQLREQSFELGSGLTVISGRNEAGKTTLFHFVRAMLFGFGRRGELVRYEPNDGPLSGAVELETAHGRYTVRREGRRRGDELEVRNGVQAKEPASRLNELLAGIAAQDFSNYFAFDLEALQEAARLYTGDRLYGGLLGAVVPGAAALPGVLQALSEESKGLYSPTARKKPLNQALDGLAEVDAELKALKGRRAEHAHVQSELEALVARWPELEARRHRAMLALDRLKGLEKAERPARAAAAAAARLAKLPDVSRLPPRALERLSELEAAAAEARGQVEQLELDAHAAAAEHARLLAVLEAPGDEAEVARGVDAWRALPVEAPEARARLDAQVEGVARELDRLGLGSGDASLASVRERLAAVDGRLDVRAAIAHAAKALAQAHEHAHAQRLRRESRAEALAALVAEQAGALPPGPELESPASLRAKLESVRKLPAAAERLEALRAALPARASLARPVGPAPWIAVGLAVIAAIAGVWLGQPWIAAVALAVAAGGAVFAWRGRSPTDDGAAAVSAHRAQVQAAERRVVELSAAAGVSPSDAAAHEQSLQEQLDAHAERARRLGALQALEGRVAAAKTAAVESDRELQEAVSDEAAAAELVRRTIAEAGLPASLPADEAQAVLHTVAELARRTEGLAAQLEASAAHAQRAAEARAELVAAGQGAGVAMASAGELVKALTGWLERRRDARTELGRLEAQAAQRAPRREALALKHRGAADRVQALLAQAGGDRDDFVRAASLQAEAVAAAEALRGAQGQLEALVQTGRDEVLAALEAIGPFAPALAAAEREAAAAQQALREAAEVKGRLEATRTALETDEAEAKLLERRQALVAQAQRLATRAGTALLAAQALSAVRERLEPQSELFREATTLFAAATEGRYVRLHEVKAEQRLEVERNDGARFDAHALSRGARELLFFAFRLAGARLFATRHLALPLVLDDVLVHQDESRLRGAAQALSLVAETTQVVFFTCHRHVREELEGAGAKVLHLERAQQLPLLPSLPKEGANARRREH